MGQLYQRGTTWWIQYYGQGQLFRESTRSERKSVAVALLKRREGEVSRGTVPALHTETTSFDELATLYLQDYRINSRKTLKRAQELTARLRESFGRLRACRITSAQIRDYISWRQAKGITNATINRELAALKRMFRLASQQTPPLLLNPPHIPHLRENNVRQGFFTEDDYAQLWSVLPDHVKIPFIIGYWTGMRAGEIVTLRWDQVDLARGLLRLEPGTTKNNHGRVIPLVGEVVESLWQWKQHTVSRYPSCPWVCHYRGTRLAAIPKKPWRTSCDLVGLAGKLFHDLRRTAVRNMIRAGVPEVVAMAISGHKTRSVFDRYNVVNEADLCAAIRQLEQIPKNGSVLKMKSLSVSTMASTMNGELEEVTRK